MPAPSKAEGVSGIATQGEAFPILHGGQGKDEGWALDKVSTLPFGEWKKCRPPLFQPDSCDRREKRQCQKKLDSNKNTPIDAKNDPLQGLSPIFTSERFERLKRPFLAYAEVLVYNRKTVKFKHFPSSSHKSRFVGCKH